MRRVQVLVPLLAALLLAACGAKEEVLAPSPLPELQGEAVKLVRTWAADTGAGAKADGLRLQPAPTARAVFAADEKGVLSSRERSKGKLLWRAATPHAFSAGPVAAYGQLFVGTREGELLVFSATDGELLWKLQLGGEVLAPPAVDNEAVLVKSTDGRITYIDRASGAQRWAHDGGAPALTLRLSSKPLLLPDAALAGLPSGALVAMDRASGKLIWERRVAEPEGKSELERLVDVAGDFIVDADRIFAASYQGRLVALDLRSGQFIWQQPLSTHQSLAVAAGSVFAVDVESGISAWRATDGVLLWRQSALRGRSLTGCAVLGDYLLAGDFEGYVHVIRQSDGVIVGRKRVDRAGIAVAPVVDERVVFVLGRSGKLAALKIE